MKAQASQLAGVARGALLEKDDGSGRKRQPDWRHLSHSVVREVSNVNFAASHVLRKHAEVIINGWK